MAGFRKYAKKVGKNLKKRYFKKGKVKAKNIKLLQVAKDVETLKTILNAEKKRIDEPNELVYPVAQTGTGLASSGYMIKRNLFEIPQGVGHREKNGNSIKCHSYHIDIKLSAVNTIQALRAKLFLVRCKEPQTLVSTSDIISKLFTPSAFGAKYDIMSPRNYENINDFQILATKNIYMAPDTVTGGQTATKILSLGGKLNFHQRTKEVPAAHTQYDTNELVLICLAEKGTYISGGTISDHILMEMTGTMYFYDN